LAKRIVKEGIMKGDKGGMDMYERRLTAAVGTAVALSVIAVAIVATCVHSVHAEHAASPFQITSHDPQAHEVGVALNANVQATFDQDVNAGTVTSDTFVVHGHLGGLVTGTFSYDGGTRTLTLDPDRAFHPGEVLRVSATEGVSSTAAVPLTPYGWQFTAGKVVARCAGAFTDIGATLPGVRYSSVAWGDYDNDGDLDILLSGGGNSWVSEVYRNDGGGVFTDVDANLIRVFVDSSVAWGDYDNDGDLDILLTGSHASGTVSRVYRNDGALGFTNIGAALAPVAAGSVAWGDYDNDGDLDILLTGNSMGTSVSKVYRNDGGGAFTDIGAGLTGVTSSSVAWGDYDNDGDLDILLTGRGASYPVTRVYRNDGSGAFTAIPHSLSWTEAGCAAWGDYDNDGDLDILLTGRDGSGPVSEPVSEVYRNDGGGVFTEIDAGLTGVYWSSVAWGDYDSDGDLDMLLTGWDGSTYVSKVYRNDDCPPELGISKEADNSSPQPGRASTYSIVISNTGGAATGVLVSDTLPTDVSFAGPVTLDPPGAGTTGAPPLLVTDATITAAGRITVTFPLTVNLYLAPDTLITNTAAVSCTEVPTPVQGSVAVTVANVKPTLGTVDPSSGSGPTGATTYFTTTCKDDNGWADLKQCYFHIGADASIVGNVTLLYNAVKDRLWLRSDDGSTWLGGCEPGTEGTIENSQAILDCKKTRQLGADDTLGLRWAIEFKPGYEGDKKTGLKCKDRSKARAKASWKGTWTVE
jgi:uncharacterized repeat protein (TIGR01451 family)